MLTLGEVSKRIGVPVSTLRHWCNSGQAKGDKIGRQWLISEEDLGQLQQKATSYSPFKRIKSKTQKALTELEADDFRTPWVPDPINHFDYLDNPEPIVSEAEKKIRSQVPFGSPTFLEVPKSPFFRASC